MNNIGVARILWYSDHLSSIPVKSQQDPQGYAHRPPPTRLRVEAESEGAQARDLEVDFLLSRGTDYLAIEVKASGDCRPEGRCFEPSPSSPGFADDYCSTPAIGVLQTEDGVDAWPVEKIYEALDTARSEGGHALRVGTL